MDKITIERETLERAITALTYHQNQTRPIERTRIALDALRAALAAQPAETQGPVAWRHSKTGRLYDSVEEVPLADGDEWAEPLYLAAPPQPAQPADAQPTGQSPCARHCEAPAFEGEIRRLKRELQTQAERIRLLREALVIIKANAGEAEQVYTVARAALEATK